MPLHYDLFIIGLGISIPSHVTLQATQALSCCTQVYSIVQEPPHLWLPPRYQSDIEVINLLRLYAEGRPRIDNYEFAAKAIIAGLQPGRSVGYVTYGNPMHYDRVAQELVEYSSRSGIATKLVPGISTIDAVLCDLRFELAPALQIFDASWLCACQIKPDVRAPLLLMQIGAFGSLTTQYGHRTDGKSLRGLVTYLANYYSCSHHIYLVRSTSDEDWPTRIRRLELGNLGEVSQEDLSGASMYVPAAKEFVFDENVLGGLE